MCDDDKPFACSAMGCGMRFSTEDHLNVHIRKHEMSLALNLGGGGLSASLGNPFLDQTPTPTKFLKNCEEIGLFQELSKNPFEEAFKKAADLPEGVPLPGPHSNDLNTPVPPDPSRLDSVIEASKGLPHSLSIKEESDKDSGVIAIEETEALDLSGRREMAKQPAAHPPQLSAASEDAGPTRTIQGLSGLANATMLPMKPVVTNSVVEMMSSPPVTMSNVAVVQPSPVVPTPIVPAPIIPAPVLPAPTTTAGSSQPVYTMQVFLQLPSGQTVPVNIPATIGPLGQQPILQQKATTPVSPITTTPTTTPTSSMALKQRLKQTLQQNNNPPMAVIKSEPVSHRPISSIPSPTIMLPESVSTSPLDSPIQSPDSHLEFMDSEFSESGYPESGKRSRRSDEDTDDRRRKFLERNRAAAARCRQKRKGWINNLEKKADDLSNTNSRLQSEVSLLRGEVAQLKTLLLAHKDCPITLQQKSQGHIALATINLVESGASASIPTITSSEVSAAVAGATDSITMAPGITAIPVSAEHLIMTQKLGKN